MTTLNSCFILMAVPMNPGLTFLLVYVVTAPYFRRVEQELAPEIDKAFEEDVSLDYYRVKGPGGNG